MSKKDFSADIAKALMPPVPQADTPVKTAAVPASRPLKPAPKPVEQGSMADSLVFGEKERRRSITVHILEPLIDKLDAVAQEKKVSRGLLVETLLSKALGIDS
jgi:hypothetical protein